MLCNTDTINNERVCDSFPYFACRIERDLNPLSSNLTNFWFSGVSSSLVGFMYVDFGVWFYIIVETLACVVIHLHVKVKPAWSASHMINYYILTNSSIKLITGCTLQLNCIFSCLLPLCFVNMLWEMPCNRDTINNEGLPSGTSLWLVTSFPYFACRIKFPSVLF